MASTNKTTNYELSQYIGTDKPTYLTDYNQDMAKIDAGIHAAKAEADSNATNIGDLTSLTTTAKTSAVAAINELDSDLGTLNTTVGNHTTAIADNTSAIGTLTNLSTTAKNNLVSAVNEVDSNTDTNTSAIGTLSNLTTTVKNNLVGAINEVDGNVDSLTSKFNFTDFTRYTTGTLSNGSLVTCDITVATNSDKSICKIYGQVATNDGNDATITLPTSFNVDTAFTVAFSGINFNRNSYTLTGFGSITFNTNGTISLSVGNGINLSYYIPALIFVSNFGDTPQN